MYVLLLYNNHKPYISLCIIVNIVGLKNVHFWDQRMGCSILLNRWCREKNIFEAYFLLFLQKVKSNEQIEVTKVLALWLCEKPLVYFSSWLEINELETKMLALVVDMVFEDT